MKTDIETLQIKNLEIIKNHIYVDWTANTGYGTCIFGCEKGKFLCVSEHMATNENKEFVYALLLKLVAKMVDEVDIVS